MPDIVDSIMGQWQRERPDVDVSTIAVIGRLSRISQRVDVAMSRNFARHGLQPGWFDVLAALRRAGGDFELTPSELHRTMMLTAGAITKRIDRLEEHGLVERRADPDDGRVVHVRLTRAGHRTVDAALVDHMATQRELLAGLDERQRTQLVTLLRAWGDSLGSELAG